MKTEIIPPGKAELIACAEESSSRLINLPGHLWYLMEVQAKHHQVSMNRLIKLILQQFIKEFNHKVPPRVLQDNPLPTEFINICAEHASLLQSQTQTQTQLPKNKALLFFELLVRYNQFMNKRGRPSEKDKQKREEFAKAYNIKIDTAPHKKLAIIPNHLQVVVQVWADEFNIKQNDVYAIAFLHFVLQIPLSADSNKDKLIKESLFPYSYGMEVAAALHVNEWQIQEHVLPSRLSAIKPRLYGIDKTKYWRDHSNTIYSAVAVNKMPNDNDDYDLGDTLIDISLSSSPSPSLFGQEIYPEPDESYYDQEEDGPEPIAINNEPQQSENILFVPPVAAASAAPAVPEPPSLAKAESSQPSGTGTISDPLLWQELFADIDAEGSK